MRARIRKEMETPSTEWDNEWQEIAGPEAILVSVVQNPQLLPLQGKTIARDRKAVEQRPVRYHLRPADSGQRFHPGRRLRHVRA